ncbi:MAG: metallophosphoesterase [Saprospiraceae bacterium]|jgi:Icc protein|nr:metallophosphoesterase [Saprospiraceae bacterium]MBL0025621.1 metallophosphoesterase [Saprospiraceae bacterium]
MKVCFITDLHIDSEGLFPLGVDTRQQFLNTLAHVVHRSYDLMIIGGDLCHTNGDVEIYKWIKSHMDDAEIPYHVISGNHDSSIMMAEVFGISSLVCGSELFYDDLYKSANILYLDTSPGMMSDKQFEWLEKKIESQTNEDVIICMHHPPLVSGSAHMEPKYLFQQTERFSSLCSNYGEKRFIIFCGHYHIARTVISKNMVVFISPSTFLQIDPDSVEFKRDSQRYGYREIIIEHEKLLRTNVIYL